MECEKILDSFVFAWDGCEVESQLAFANGKELSVVVRGKVEESPEAFYRVREEDDTTDFNNWQEAVDYYNCI